MDKSVSYGEIGKGENKCRYWSKKRDQFHFQHHGICREFWTAFVRPKIYCLMLAKSEHMINKLARVEIYSFIFILT